MTVTRAPTHPPTYPSPCPFAALSGSSAPLSSLFLKRLQQDAGQPASLLGRSGSAARISLSDLSSEAGQQVVYMDSGAGAGSILVPVPWSQQQG